MSTTEKTEILCLDMFPYPSETVFMSDIGEAM